MAVASLLEANPLKWKQSFLIQLHPPRIPRINHTFIKSDKFCATLNAKGSVRYSVNCFFSQKHLTDSSSEPLYEESSKNPFEFIADTILYVLKALRNPAIAAVLLGLLLMYDPKSAVAASGGRMGGRSFSSHSSSSHSSRSYSVPSTPSPGFSYSAPYYAPSPFGFSGGSGGFYFGPAVGVGVGAGSSLFLILVGFAAFILVSGFLSDRSEGSVLTATEKTTVLKLQVGLLGLGRLLQKDLNRIAETADTSSSEGLSYILTETTLSLLRHPDYCISGYSSVDLKRSIEDVEKRFNQLSIEERGKFDEETLVNVNNIKKQSMTSQRPNSFRNEYIVITILVAAEGVHKVPAINGSGDLKEALQKLGSIPSSKLLAVEVLWTPQNENDTLSERELLEDYPLLRPL
ncbi:Myelin-associated oligodendrocyte basic protein [Quillaja saponaria]|uniref:Myelin-associated oligodendrocyte basic protein n=1 Tax=Quillaja saponaria TaxID=32244 RepID=A0AAD7VJH6_QUISA|nr:Myelin-associated oligodendrocyte basic protein [Quillaja saponaria]KAJ7978082.1 Myelin-associated oligodendrocyte basic protein [Quillaja saponaria]